MIAARHVLKRSAPVRAGRYITAMLSVGWLLSVPGMAAPPEPQSEVAPAEIARWIGELDSDVYVVREQATAQLVKGGRTAVEPLVEAADAANLETASRALRVLLQLAQSEDDALATLVLKKVASLKNRPVESDAARALLARLQEDRALSAIQRLGAISRGDYVVDARVTVGHLHLGEAWKGGDQGIKHLRHLTSLQVLSIHGVPITDKTVPTLAAMTGLSRLELYGTKISPQGLATLRKALTQVDLDVRAGALLGVGGMPDARGARVTTVLPNSAASNADIRPNDVIAKFNGKPVGDFTELTAHIAKCGPGDTANLEVLRDGRLLKKQVAFGQWR